MLFSEVKEDQMLECTGTFFKKKDFKDFLDEYYGEYDPEDTTAVEDFRKSFDFVSNRMYTARRTIDSDTSIALGYEVLHLLAGSNEQNESDETAAYFDDMMDKEPEKREIAKKLAYAIDGVFNEELAWCEDKKVEVTPEEIIHIWIHK